MYDPDTVPDEFLNFFDQSQQPQVLENRPYVPETEPLTPPIVEASTFGAVAASGSTGRRVQFPLGRSVFDFQQEVCLFCF